MAVRIEDVAPAVREAQYAVRGPIVVRAQELERAGREIIYCNIGNPQSLGQRPLTWSYVERYVRNVRGVGYRLLEAL